MAVEYSGLDVSFVAAESLAAMQYRYVVQASDTTVRMANAGTDFPIGILQNAPGNGETAVVRITGTSKLAMNAAVTVGSQVKCEYVGAADNGKGDAADTDYDIVRGICIKASGAEDDVGAVMLTAYVLMVA
jgi:hypothetical protein